MNEANRIVNTDEEQRQDSSDSGVVERIRRAKPKLLIDNTKKQPNLCQGITKLMPGDNKVSFHWFRTDKDYCKKMLQARLHGTERLVLDALMLKMTAGNMVHNTKYKDLSEMTGIAPPNISVALNKLIEHDLVIRLERGEYMVNPFYAYMGSSETRSSSIAKYRRLKQDQINKAAPSRP